MNEPIKNGQTETGDRESPASVSRIDRLKADIREKAKRRGWNKPALAKQAGVPYSTVRDIDNPNWNPRASTLRDLENAFRSKRNRLHDAH